MQQFVRETSRRLEGVPKSVAEIEQRALAGLALVARHDRGLSPARDRDRVLARGTARKGILPVRFQPGEEAGIAEQAELRKLRIAGAEIALRQGVEQGRIGHDENGLVERADEVLAVTKLMPVLPPTEESTWASRVVGTCTKSSPRLTLAAA